MSRHKIWCFSPSMSPRAVAELREPLLPERGPVLAAGLGNPAMTADALGPRMLDHRRHRADTSRVR